MVGYEALTRVSPDAFSGPDQLFKAAYDNDSVWKLERLCRERAIRGARGLAEDKVRTLVAANTSGRTFGVLGEPRVNVLALNLALDRTKP